MSPSVPSSDFINAQIHYTIQKHGFSPARQDEECILHWLWHITASSASSPQGQSWAQSCLTLQTALQLPKTEPGTKKQQTGSVKALIDTVREEKQKQKQNKTTRHTLLILVSHSPAHHHC